MTTVIIDPQGRKNHWLVGDKLIAGPTTAGAALEAMESIGSDAEPPTTWDMIRAQRNVLLSASDWTQIADSPLLSDPSWLNYRQSLRDITSDFDNPDDVVWPTSP